MGYSTSEYGSHVQVYKINKAAAEIARKAARDVESATGTVYHCCLYIVLQYITLCYTVLHQVMSSL